MAYIALAAQYMTIALSFSSNAFIAWLSFLQAHDIPRISVIMLRVYLAVRRGQLSQESRKTMNILLLFMHLALI